MHVPFLLLQKIYLVFFYYSYVSIWKDLQRTSILYRALLCKYLHLQYNVFVISDELKAVPQRLSHDKMTKKTLSKLTGEHLTQKRDSNKVAAMPLY